MIQPFPRFILCIIAVVLLSGCDSSSCHEKVKSPELTAVKVQQYVPSLVNRPISEDVVGTLSPRMRSVIASKVSGRVEQLTVVSGQNVSEGDVLARLESNDIEAKVAQAKAVFFQAEQDLRRIEKLYREKLVTQQEYDGAVSRERVARAGVDEAQSVLGYATIKAPFSGVVAKKYVDVGDLASPGVPLLELITTGSLRFEAEVPEAIIGFAGVGTQVEISVSNYPNTVQGKIGEVVPVADPNSRTFLVKIDLPETPGLLPGQFGRVKISVGSVSALMVPSTSIAIRGQLEIVYTINQGRAWIRLVKTGKQSKDGVEILAGLKAGEAIVQSQVESLQDGQPIVLEVSK